MNEYSFSPRQPRFTASHQRRFSRRRGQSLIGLLVVIIIGLGIYMLFLGPRKGANGERKTSVLKKSLDRAEDVNTTNNIMQIQLSINQFKLENERAPASLEELKAYAKEFPAEMWVDSVSKQPLIYDSQTGTISSPTGGLPGVPGSAPRLPEGSAPTGPGGVTLPNIPGASSTQPPVDPTEAVQ